MLGIPKYEQFLYAALKQYQPAAMENCDFERAVDHLMEYNFLQVVHLDKIEVVYRKDFKLSALGFMYGKDKELAEVDKKFSAYLLELATSLITFVGSSVQQFQEQTKVAPDLLTLPDRYFRCYRVGTRLFGAKVEQNDTGGYSEGHHSTGILRVYSEPKYGVFREYTIED